MRSFRFSILVLLLFALLSAPTFANTVKMKFLAGTNDGGPFEVYQYYFSINGSQNQTALICDDFSDEITLGQTWNATVTPLLSDQGLFSKQKNSLQEYEAAGLIFEGILNHTYSALAGNWAIWAIFTPSAMNNSFWSMSGAQSIYNFWTSNNFSEVANLTPTEQQELAGLVVYTPTPNGSGQEFIGLAPPSQTPEPGSMALLGTGLIVLGRSLRKKLLA